MPTNPHIFAATNIQLSVTGVRELSVDLVSQLDAKCFMGRHADHNALSLIAPADYILLPDNIPKHQTIIQAHPDSPYYGPAYARGYWPELVAIIEFLRHRVEGATVWYGPDGSDYCEEVTQAFVEAMWKYWAQNGTRPYHKQFIKPTL